MLLEEGAAPGARLAQFGRNCDFDLNREKGIAGDGR